jgi:hypothetical protein
VDQAVAVALLLAVLLAERVLPIKAMMVELVVLFPAHLMAAAAVAVQVQLAMLQHHLEQVELVAQA